MKPFATRVSLNNPRGFAVVRAEFPRWICVVDDLLDPRFCSVTPTTAKKLISEDWAIVDVRPSNKEYKVPGAIEIPIFEVMSGATGSKKKKARYLAQTLLGVVPTELNQTFVSDVKEATGGANVIVMCEKGGSLAVGKEIPSRSLKAAWQLIVGDKDIQVAHLLGGTRGWVDYLTEDFE